MAETSDASDRKRKYMRQYYQDRKAKLRSLKHGRKCEKCGFADPRALDFHHRDPATKSFSLSAENAWRRPWKAVLEEVEKCDVICANCHRILHARPS